MLVRAFGVWGLVVSLLLVLGLAVLTHLPDITQLMSVLCGYRERRRVLDDLNRTDRYIVMQNSVPLDP